MAWMLMLVGMITVFVVLTLVVLSGRLLTYLVNKYAPEEVVVKRSGMAATAAIEDTKRKAIETAVGIITGGRGKVTKIEKK